MNLLLRLLFSAFLTWLLTLWWTFASYQATSQDEDLVNFINTKIDTLSSDDMKLVCTIIDSAKNKFEVWTRKRWFADELMSHIDWYFLHTFSDDEESICSYHLYDLYEEENSNTSTAENIPEVLNWNTIWVHYIWTLEDGSVFDTSRSDIATEAGLYDARRAYTPLEFTVGAKQMISGFDSGVVGMKLWERKTLTILPEDAYGKTWSHFLAGKTLLFDVEIMEIK